MLAERPSVAVFMLAYNHGPYIAQAIEGVLMQKTDFPVLLVIGEDNSTDNTRQICIDYQEKYPNRIKLLLRENNLGMMRNTHETLKECSQSGKYTAFCEGDDYWTDANKLQIQVDYLENHPDHSMCFHEAQTICEDGSKDILFSDLQERDYTSEEVLQNWLVPTASIVCKSEILKKVPESNKFLFGDIIIVLTLAEYGKIHCLAKFMSVYRRTQTGAVLSSKVDVKYMDRMADHYREIGQYFKKISPQTVEKLITRRQLDLCSSYIRSGHFSKFVKTYRYYRKKEGQIFTKAFNNAICEAVKHKL